MTKLVGMKAYSRFGHAMASLGDISGDGFDGEREGEKEGEREGKQGGVEKNELTLQFGPPN